MRILELFSGSNHISQKYQQYGHEVMSVELNEKLLGATHYMSVLDLSVEQILDHFNGKVPDIIWASPPCQTWSIASIYCHWNTSKHGKYIVDRQPKTDKAVIGVNLIAKTIELIGRLKSLNPNLIFFIENPRGTMRKYPPLELVPRYTITYCQYGDTRMKPTDIWTNHPNPKFKKVCKNGDSCHISAPRGAKTGTQGLKGNFERSLVPEEFIKHIVAITTNKENIWY